MLFAGADITHCRDTELRALRRPVQVVFHNPHAALDPRMSVFAAVAEPLRLLGGLRRAALRDQIAALLGDVGLGAEFMARYPNELSGGQTQRVCIARAPAPQPCALLLDEPTSALDVSAQAQIIELLAALRVRHGLAHLLVSHNLAMVWLLCEQVAVMQNSRIVEAGAAAHVLAEPRHAQDIARQRPTGAAGLNSCHRRRLMLLLVSGVPVVAGMPGHCEPTAQQSHAGRAPEITSLRSQ